MSDAETYRAILQRDPTDNQAFVALCNIAEREGDFDYLAELYKYRAQITKDAQEIADLFFRAGEVFIDKLNDLPRGVESLLQGFEHDKSHAGIGDRLDAIYREAEDWEAALQILEQRLEELERNDINGTKVVIRSDLHQQAGEIWEHIYQDRDRALRQYKKAIELDKTNLLALYGAREIYYEAAKYKNAAKLCELEARAEKEQERRVALYRELAHLLVEHLSDPDQAVVALKRALKFDPQNEEIKTDLARTVAATTLTAENQKDHHWACDFLLRQAMGSDGEESLQLARLSLLALPSNRDALGLVEQRARSLGRPDELAEAYQQIIDACPNVESQAPWVRRLARIYVEELGMPQEALSWLRRIAGLREPQDLQAISQLERGMSAQGLAESKQAVKLPHPPRAASDRPPTGQAREPIVAEPVSLDEFPKGMSEAEYIEALHKAAERARRSGNDVAAEERMLQVLELSPQDQKATTYLERRFRARGDWSSLRDLLMSSCGAQHLPPAVQTVRLREAARLSEEQLADVEGAIEAWKLIRENDPKVRDAADALSRLLADAGRWEELLEILVAEAENTRSRTKRLEGYRRIAQIHEKEVGDLPRAADAHRRILELVPDDEESLESLDSIYGELQSYDDLVPLLQKRAELSRNREAKRDFLLRAALTMRERLGKNEQAYGMCKDILAISPRDQEILEVMESIDEEEQSWGRLVGVLDMRAQAAPSLEESTAYVRKKAHVAMHQLGDSRLAINSWNQLLDMVPGDSEALSELIELNRSAGNFEKLVEVLRIALDHVSNDAEKIELHRQLARVLENELDRPEAAMDSWKAVVELEPDSESLRAMCRWFERVERWDELIEYLRLQSRYAEEHEERAAILFRVAQIFKEKVGDAAAAIGQLESIVSEVDPSHKATLDLLSDLLVEAKDYAKAAEFLDQRIGYTEDPEDLFERLVTLGDWSRTRLDDLQRAMHAYERAAGLKNDDEGLVDTLDEVYAALGEWERLIKLLYAKANRQSDNETKLSIMTRGARICEENLGDFGKAWIWYKEIFEKLGELPGVIETLEEAASRMELWPELIEMYGALTRKTEDVDEQVGWWLKIADVFEQKRGDSGQALEAVLRAFGLRPEMEELLDRVDRLAVSASNWQRLATVYGVLVNRADAADEKIDLLTRYANVLADDGDQHHDAFDVSLKAFEIDPKNEELLALVEKMAHASKRWKDMIRVYNVCTRLIEEPLQRSELKLRCVPLYKGELNDPEGALGAILDAFRYDCFNETIVSRVWDEVQKLEVDLLPAAQGTYWNKLIEAYRVLAAEHRQDREKQMELLTDVSRIYEDKRKDPAAAFDAMRDAHRVFPKSNDAIDRLESLAEQHDMWEFLVSHYQDILDEIFEMDVAVMLHRRRASVLVDHLDRADEAAEHYWQLIQLDGNDNEAYDKLLAYYADAGRWNELVNLLERKLDSASEDQEKREILMQIAGIWRDEIGNRFEAKDWYEQVITLWPDDEEAKTAIEGLGLGRKSVIPEEEDEDEEDEDIRSLISIPPPPQSEEDEKNSFEATLPTTPPPAPSTLSSRTAESSSSSDETESVASENTDSDSGVEDIEKENASAARPFDTLEDTRLEVKTRKRIEEPSPPEDGAIEQEPASVEESGAREAEPTGFDSDAAVDEYDGLPELPSSPPSVPPKHPVPQALQTTGEEELVEDAEVVDEGDVIEADDIVEADEIVEPVEEPEEPIVGTGTQPPPIDITEELILDDDDLLEELDAEELLEDDR